MKNTESVCDGCGFKENTSSYKDEHRILSISASMSGSKSVYISFDLCPKCIGKSPEFIIMKAREYQFQHQKSCENEKK